MKQKLFLRLSRRELNAQSKTKAKIITEIKRTDYGDVIKKLDFDTVICPENIVSDMILRYIRSLKGTSGSNMEALYNICKGQAEASEFVIRHQSKIVGTPLSKLKFKKNVLVAAIVRDGQVIIPRGYDMIQTGDAVIVVSKITGLHDITDILE